MHCTTAFHLYFIPLHIGTKISCFKGVYALRFFANCHSMKNQKNDKKRALASILRVFAVLFHIKTMKIEQFTDYLDTNFSYWPQMTL